MSAPAGFGKTTYSATGSPTWGGAGPSRARVAAALTSLVNDITAAGGGLPDRGRILVLDDYHVIEAPDVHEAVTFLLDYLPD